MKSQAGERQVKSDQDGREKMIVKVVASDRRGEGLTDEIEVGARHDYIDQTPVQSTK